MNTPKDTLLIWDLKDAKCPACGISVNSATPAGDEDGGPEPGSLGICAKCIAVNQYADDGKGGLILVPFDVSEMASEERAALDNVLAQFRQLKARSNGDFLPN